MLNPCTADVLEALSTRIPGLLRQPQARDVEEPRGRWRGLAGAVACPRSTQEVAQVVRACADARVGIVPMGGGTGLVGGQVLAEGAVPLVLSL